MSRSESMVERCESEYISSGIATYCPKVFWTVIDEINSKNPPNPATLELIRRKFPQLQGDVRPKCCRK